MPGIFGWISPDKAQREAQLHHMIQPLTHRGWYVNTHTTAQGASIGCVDLDGTMGCASEGNTHLTCFGELADFPTLRERLQKADTKPASSLPEVLLQAYLAFGREALEGLNGYYAIAIWEESEQRLTLINDRGGVAKIYYWHHGDTFLFAPEMKAITWHTDCSQDANPLAIYELFALTFPLRDRTLLRDVKLLEQATTLTWERGNISTTQNWHHHATPVEDPDAPLEVYTDGYLERLRTAVLHRYNRGDTGLYLTGGLDSRVIAGILIDEGLDNQIHAVTAGDPWGHDIRFARQLANKGRFKHHVIPVGADYLPRYAPEALHRSEGMTSAHVSWAICSNDLCEAQGLRHMLSGYLGCGGVAHNFPLDENPDDAFDVLVHRAFNGLLSEDRIQGLLKKNLYDSCVGVPLQHLREHYDSLEGLPTASRNEVLRRDEQHRRFISVDLYLQGATTRPRFPYDDIDVWDYLLAIPMQHRRGKRFFLDLICRHYPALAKVPRSGDAIPIGGSKFHKLRHRAGQRIYHRILPKVTGGRLGGRNLEKGVYYADWQRTGSREFILDLLNKTEYYDDVLDVDTLRKQVQDHLEGKTTDYGLVHSLVSLVIGRESIQKS